MEMSICLNLALMVQALEEGEGYQIKMTNTEYGFSFCEHITWPNLEGCTDCEAVNFNQWANVDDGSCNYDSDGDGVPDSEEVVGCQDATAWIMI